MTDPKELLIQLKDYSRCNDNLAITIRQTILEPFKLDLTQVDAVKRPPPTPAKFKQMAAKLAPLAMSIANQNMQSLAGLKGTNIKSSSYIIVVNCLVDTSFYALAALRHMNTYTFLKPLDIEKTTSNIIGKMVDIGEYHRALDELKKFRSLLGSVAKVQLESKATNDSTSKVFSIKRSRKEDQSTIQKESFLPIPSSIIGNQWEQEMLTKYQDLFQFPFDATINDHTMILLVLAYQMNALRSWCEVGDGALAKYVPYFMEKSGNLIDWSKHLLLFDSNIAKKQLDSFQKLLYKAANRYPLTESAAFHCFHIQTVALNIIKLSGLYSLKQVMDRMVRIGMTYEKATSQTSYPQIQERCKHLLEDLNPNINNEMEMDSYFILCEYYAYVSQKTKSHTHLFYAYQSMARPLAHVISKKSTCSFYHAAYASNANLALTSLQMDKMIADDMPIDIYSSFKDIINCLDAVSESLTKSPTQNEHTERALYSLCKSIDGFRQSAKHLYEFVAAKTKKALQESKNNPYKTPPRLGELVAPSDFGPWNSNMAQLNSVLELCSEILPESLILTKKKPNPINKRTVSQSDIMMSFIDIMVLLARLVFKIHDDETHSDAYEYLSTAERKCDQANFPEGYRWLSGSYYNLGAIMIKTEQYKSALHPLHKACNILKKDTERIQTPDGMMQLCKRFEILGTCCQKTEEYADAIAAYRASLKCIPMTVIKQFVSRAETTAISSIIETEPFIPKIIDRFLRSSIIDPNQSEICFASAMIKLLGLTPVQKAVIYECELKVWDSLALKMNVTKFQLAIIDKLLDVYTKREYPIRRARVLLSRVCVERESFMNKQQSTRDAMASAQSALDLLNVTNYGKDTELLNYRRHYIALATSWLAICGRELKKEAPEHFATTLQQWGLLLKPITPIYNSGGTTKQDKEAVYKAIDDIEQLYNHVRMLVDLFGVTGESVYQIRALRILLKLNNGLRDVTAEHVSDSIILSCRIARVYIDLGYTGKAATELSDAHNTIKCKPCNNMSELIYGISYAYYLACIGNFESCKRQFENTKAVWDYTPNVDTKNELLTAKAYIERCMLLSDAYATKSLLLANTDTIDSAIDCSTASLQLLNKCIKVAQKTTTDRSEKKASTELENPFIDPPTPKPANQDIVFRESQWAMAEKLSVCLNRLASLYMKKGSWVEVNYFMKEGPLLAQKVNSNSIYFYSYLISIEYYRRCGDLDNAHDYVKLAKEYQPTGDNHNLDNVHIMISLANSCVSNGLYTEAIAQYENTNTDLDILTGAEHISSIEPTEHVQEVSTNVMYDDEVDQLDKYDFIPLKLIKSEVIIQLALALANKGNTENGLVLLKGLEEEGYLNQNMPQLHEAIAQIRYKMLCKEITDGTTSKILTHECMSLPEMREQADKRPARSSQNKLLLMQDEFTTSMDRILSAYHLGYMRECPVLIESVCKQSVFSMFLQSRMLNHSKASTYALNSAYYLEIAKGLCLRRDMQTCLRIKQRKPQVANDKNWPCDNNEQAFLGFDLDWLNAHLNELSTLYAEEKNLEAADFQERYVNIIPSNWTVCSLSYDPIHNDLYAVQLRAGEVPFVVKIPLSRCARRPRDFQTLSYSEALAEFQNIIQGSDATIQESSSCKDPESVERWWNTRRNLDERLKSLLDMLEDRWFGGFRGILGPRDFECLGELKILQKKLSDMAYKIMGTLSSVKPCSQDLEDISYFILSLYEAQITEVDSTKLNFINVKDELRLLITQYHDRSRKLGYMTDETMPNEHAILILDKHLQMFPIESMPILIKQPVSRLPCLSFLRDRILYARAHAARNSRSNLQSKWQDLSISKKSAFYVLNPGGDLKDTQKLFEPIFNNIREWTGVKENMPLEMQCKEALQNHDIYMYFGHSAGQSFMRGNTIKQLPRCAVSLLMGCSSAVLESKGEFDAHGYALNFLLGGSPAVVGNLWDVTDRSIDRLTKHMLQTWGVLSNTNNSKISLVQALSCSRSQGKLIYLIGAATVVYGIPVYVQ